MASSTSNRPGFSTMCSGSYFAQWGVPLTSTRLGSFKGSCDNMHWWVNDVRQAGNPARLVLTNHEEIVISIGAVDSAQLSRKSVPEEGVEPSCPLEGTPDFKFPRASRRASVSLT